MSTTTSVADFQKKELPARVKHIGLILLLLGLMAAGIAFAIDLQRGSFNLLILFLYATSIGAGALFFVALEYIAGAVWSVPVRRVMEYLSGILPVVPLLAVPLLFTMHELFHWTHAEAVATDALLQAKEPYLNVPFFVVRFVAVFALLNLFYFLFVRNSRRQDLTRDPKLTKINIRLAAAFMPVFAITITVISVDWIMSLEPHWFSTIFGIYFFSGSVLTALAAGTWIIVTLNEHGYFPGLRKDHYYSLGALLFAFVNFWAYIAFSQFMLIWYANIPEETFWFSARWQGGWEYVSVGLIILQWLVPYFVLLPQEKKMEPKTLRFVAVWLLVAHLVDLYWLVLPTYMPKLSLGWVELLVPVGVVGLVMLAFDHYYKKHNFIPVGDPKLQRGLDFRL